MDSEFASDMLIVLEEWRLVIIVVGITFLAWALWYTSGGSSTQHTGTKSGKRKVKDWEAGDRSNEEDDYGNGEEDAAGAAAQARAAESRRVAVENTLRRPLSLAEEIVAIHNITS